MTPISTTLTSPARPEPTATPGAAFCLSDSGKGHRTMSRGMGLRAVAMRRLA